MHLILLVAFIALGPSILAVAWLIWQAQDAREYRTWRS